MTLLGKFTYYLCALVFVFILAETFLLPTQNDKDSINHFGSVSSGTSRSHWVTTILYTKSGLIIPLSEDQRYNFDDTCALSINKGVFFGRPINIEIISAGMVYQFSTSILLRTSGGNILTILMIVCFLVSFIKLLLKKKQNLNIIVLFEVLTFFIFIELLFNITSLLIP